MAFVRTSSHSRTSPPVARPFQSRLASGKKVNSALDNPTNFFTAASLNSRSNDLGGLLDGMSNGIKTLEAADNGLKSIMKTVESLQSAIRQARQDKSWQGTSYAFTATSGTGDIVFTAVRSAPPPSPSRWLRTPLSTTSSPRSTATRR